ncbi:hypothetical protein GWI33_015884 [Rhynchophorus ferrugineus]|uniref:Uncharacterized protein n=1 Tax=Rhynchophorus ferrugineus TaxID=354439 RepID=A0A834M7N2_RHYFE|nr:hypothetical protein GWI33_015884 [Rhynchophorus ferrugineus]
MEKSLVVNMSLDFHENWNVGTHLQEVYTSNYPIAEIEHCHYNQNSTATAAGLQTEFLQQIAVINWNSSSKVTCDIRVKEDMEGWFGLVWLHL